MRWLDRFNKVRHNKLCIIYFVTCQTLCLTLQFPSNILTSSTPFSILRLSMRIFCSHPYWSSSSSRNPRGICEEASTAPSTHIDACREPHFTVARASVHVSPLTVHVSKVNREIRPQSHTEHRTCAEHVLTGDPDRKSKTSSPIQLDWLDSHSWQCGRLMLAWH